MTEADVWLGAAKTVPLVAPADLSMLVPREDRSGVKARVVYQGPIEAPIAKGQKLATLEVEVPGHDDVSFDLVAGADVPRGGLLTRHQRRRQLSRDQALSYLPGRRARPRPTPPRRSPPSRRDGTPHSPRRPWSKRRA